MWGRLSNIERMQSPVAERRGGARLSPVALASPEHLLMRHPLLRGANESKLAGLLARVPIQRAPMGALLSNPDMSGGLTHLVLIGTLKSYQVNTDGDELLLEVIDAGGLDRLLPADGPRGHFTEASEDSLLGLITDLTLQRLMAADGAVASNLIRILSARLAARERRLQVLAIHDPMRRLASLLLSLAETGGARHRAMISIKRQTHETLGNMIGMRAIAVGLHLRQLIALGALTVKQDRCFLDVEVMRGVVDRMSPPSRRGARNGG
jgi:CRP-like cAMP-binding protein